MGADASTQQLLTGLLALPPSSLPATFALPAVSSSLSAALRSSSSSSDRQLLHALCARAAPIKGALASLPLLAQYLAAFLPHNAQLARTVARDALAANVRLAEGIRTHGVAALGLALEKVQEAATASTAVASSPSPPPPAAAAATIEAAMTLLALVRGTAPECFASSAASASGGRRAATDTLGLITTAYTTLVVSGGGVALDELLLALLDTAHTLLSTTTAAAGVSTAASLEALRDLLVLLLPTTGGSSAGSSPSPLARDLAAADPALIPTLLDAVTGSVGPTARQVKDLLGGWRRRAAAPTDEGEGPDADGLTSLPEWLERMRRARAIGGAAATPAAAASRFLKEEQKVPLAGSDRTASVTAGVDPDREAELALANSHLLDLFPHLPPPFIRAALLHPHFSGFSTSSSSSGAPFESATEALVAALLDDAQLPADLVALRDGVDDPRRTADAPSSTTPPPTKITPKKKEPPVPHGARRAVYDDDRLFTRGTLLRPANARRAGTAAGAAGGRDLALDETLKANIMALAEAPSSDEDEEDEDEEDGAAEAFLEGDEDGGPAGGAQVRIVREGGAGGGEALEGESEDEGASSSVDENGEGRFTGKGRAATEAGGRKTVGIPTPTSRSSTNPGPSSAGNASSPAAAAVQLALESAYLAQPEIFARDSATRRSRARKDLRERTGLADEQIEGWRSMLERDAKKMQRLRDKHQDLAARGNRSSEGSGPHHHQQQQQQQQEEGGGPKTGARTGGGAQGGRGGAARGGGGTAGRGRGDGGRKEHDRAKRGRDRKMARMGALA